MGNCNCDSKVETFDPEDLINDSVHKRDRSEDLIIARAGLKRTVTENKENNYSKVFDEFKNFLATNNLILCDEDVEFFDQEEEENDKVKDINNEIKSVINTAIKDMDSKETGDENDKLYFFGNVKFSDNSIYRGTWNRNFQKHGKGILKEENGKYAGDFNMDFVSGKGYYFSSLKNLYIGEFVNRIAEGEGEVFLKDSPNYYFKGMFNDNKMHGYGQEKFEDGSTFEGEFINGFKRKGKFTFSNGCIYVGEFSNNKIENFGIYTWADGRKYEGNFCNNQIHGKAKFTFSDGRIYEGEYKNGIKDGKGKVIYTDNSCYYGEWVNDMQHGHFSKTNPDNTKEKSFWRFGKKIKNI